MEFLATFDIDNTLIRSSAGHMAALISAIEETYGLKTDIHVIRHHGMTDQEIITRILERYDIGGAVIGSGLEACMAQMQQQYAETVQTENIVILEGVSTLLTRLDRKGVALGLVTGNLESIARAKLDKIGIGHFFKFGGFGSDHPRRTELVKIAIRRAGNLFDLEGNTRIFHFGDAVQDMNAAREAGVIPIGVATGVFSVHELEAAGAHRVVPNFKDADAILELMREA